MRSAATASVNDIPFLRELASDWTLWFYHHTQIVSTAGQEVVIPGQNLGYPRDSNDRHVFGQDRTFWATKSDRTVLKPVKRTHLRKNTAVVTVVLRRPTETGTEGTADQLLVSPLRLSEGSLFSSLCCCLACPSQPTVSCLTSW